MDIQTEEQFLNTDQMIIKRGMIARVSPFKKFLFKKNSITTVETLKAMGIDYRRNYARNYLERVKTTLEQDDPKIITVDRIIKSLKEKKNQQLQSETKFPKPENFEKITKEEYKQIVETNFPGLWPVVDLILSTLCVLKLKKWTDPVGINFEGPPSGQKTTALSFFYDVPIVYVTDNFTSKSFVSHSNTNETELSKIDLLPRIKNKMMIVPELGTIFSKRKEDLTEAIGIITRVFDGEGLETDSGSKGRRGYRGEYLFCWTGATTPLSKTAWNVMGKMGSRLFFLKTPEAFKTDSVLEDIFSGGVGYGDKMKKCKEATLNLFYSVFSDCEIRNVEWDDSKDDLQAKIVARHCAELLCLFRASISIYDDIRSLDDFEYKMPLIEEPFRILNIFKNVARGHAISEGRNFLMMQDVFPVVDLALSSMPDERYEALCVFFKRYYVNGMFQGVTIKDIADGMNVSDKVARRIMKTFVILGLLKQKECEDVTEPFYYLPSEILETHVSGFVKPIFAYLARVPINCHPSLCTRMLNISQSNCFFFYNKKKGGNDKGVRGVTEKGNTHKNNENRAFEPQTRCSPIFHEDVIGEGNDKGGAWGDRKREHA